VAKGSGIFVHRVPGVPGRIAAAEGLAGRGRFNEVTAADGPLRPRASSGSYWNPERLLAYLYYLAVGCRAGVVARNARDVSTCPAGKSDTADCVWLCKLNGGDAAPLVRAAAPVRDCGR